MTKQFVKPYFYDVFQDLLTTLRPFSQVFAQHQKQIFLVGGAVRDRLLGKESSDFDFTTDATPQEVVSYFKKVLLTGIKHGTVTVLFSGQKFEVTTFRIDGKYSDHRHPEFIDFTPSLEEDLNRRDFTINALALDLIAGTLQDYHGGKEDLNRCILRAIREPHQRFQEDALRILRLLRFSAKLNFQIEERTYAAAKTCKFLIPNLSKERIHDELIKLMETAQPSNGLFPLCGMEIASLIFTPIHLEMPTEEEIKAIDGLGISMRWPFFLFLLNSQAASDQWKEILKTLTFSNAEVQSIVLRFQSLQQVASIEATPLSCKNLVNQLHEKKDLDFIASLSSLPQISSSIAPDSVHKWQQELTRISQTEEPIFLDELHISGNDLINDGWTPGKSLGRVLKELQIILWENPNLNRKEDLINEARRLKKLLFS